MAQNVDRPNGLKIQGTLGGAPFNANLRVQTLNTTEDLFRGDGVRMLTAGTLEQLNDTTTQTLLGTFVGLTGVEMRSDASGEHPGFWDFSAVPSADALICYAQGGTIWEVQEDGDTSRLALTDLGGGVQVIGGSTGSTTTGISGMELDSNVGSTANSTEPFNLLRLVDRPDNVIGTATLPNARWLVTGLDIQFSTKSTVLG